MPTFKHSGHLGDVIWSLPTIKALGGGTLYLQPNQLGVYQQGTHPLGTIQLCESWIEKLIPLLKLQPYITDVQLYTGQAIDYDLDLFRKSGFDFAAGHIGKYYSHVFACAPDFGHSWLKVPASQATKGLILVNRTTRYHNPALNYNFLFERNDVAFVGFEDEYNELARTLHGKLRYYGEAKDFLELASWIGGCKAFIGNQSTCMALAEGMKKKVRVLEVCKLCPNVILTGTGAYECINQKCFEAAFKVADSTDTHLIKSNI